MNDVIYQYDGSLDGFLCCVYESYVYKEAPAAFCCDEDPLSLYEVRTVVTQPAYSQRVSRGIAARSGKALAVVRRGFLTCLPDQGAASVCLHQEAAGGGTRLYARSIRPGLLSAVSRHPPYERRAGKTARFCAVFGLRRYTGRRDRTEKPCAAAAARPFCQRYANEQFFIYDRTHRELLLYANGRSRITQIENFKPVLPGEDELYFRSLWKQFFQSVAIRERENPRCQNTFMPKRYRGTMTEFLPLEYEKEQGASPKLPGASGTDG